VGWPAFFKKPDTNSLIEEKEKQLDSPLSLLRFDSLSLWSRLHMGVGLFSLKVVRNGLWLEKYRVVEMLPKLVGKDGYKKVWKPLLMAKFGLFLPKVNMAWFWARVYKRTANLGYFKGGFGKLAEKIAEKIESLGGEIKLGVEYKANNRFDIVLNTVPPPGFAAGATQPRGRNLGVDYLWAQTLVLELNKSLMNGYWLNILEKNWPFLVVVEQTNFVDKKYYGDRHVVYFGNYLEGNVPHRKSPHRNAATQAAEPSDEKHFDERLLMDDEELLELYLPYIKKINPDFKKSWIRRKWRFQNNYAQPVFPVDYSKMIPNIKTKVPGVYVANMSMVYPWDRGVNFAVELGKRAARIMISNSTPGVRRRRNTTPGEKSHKENL